MTPKQAIKKECSECMGGMFIECLSDICYLNPKNYPKIKYLPKRIKAHCEHCAPNRRIEECEEDTCSLWIYRFGKNPNRVSAGKRVDREKLREISPFVR